MSSSTTPRPTIHASLPYTWLWCSDHATVTLWFISIPAGSIHHCRFFYTSFINACNRAYTMSIDPCAKLSKLDDMMIDCMLEDPIPAKMMIQVLQKYNHFLDGRRGVLKRNGLIRFEDDMPEIEAIEAGEHELYKHIEATIHLCRVENADINTDEAKSKNKKNKEKKKKKQAAINKAEDEEMQDVDMADDEQPLPPLNDVSPELSVVAAAPTPHKQNVTINPVRFGEMPLVGGQKKDQDDEDMKIN